MDSEHAHEQSAKANALAAKRFYFLITLLALILIFAVASLVLWIATPRPQSEVSTANDGIFAVETVTLEGNTKYHEEAVIGESGVLVGQSVFSIDSNKIEAHLLETFPYFSTVEVQTFGMSEVRITVTETSVIGVIYSSGHWVPVGANGKALDEWEITSDRPDDSMVIKGTTAPEGGVVVGGMAMDSFSTTVVDEILTAMRQYELTDIVEIDMTDVADITMNWRDQILIKLGNSSNLSHEIGMVATTIPSVINSRGEQITGVLDVSSYSVDSLENQAIFTPSSLLPTTTTASRRLIDEETDTTSVNEEESEDETDTE